MCWVERVHFVVFFAPAVDVFPVLSCFWPLPVGPGCGLYAVWPIFVILLGGLLALLFLVEYCLDEVALHFFQY